MEQKFYKKINVIILVVSIIVIFIFPVYGNEAEDFQRLDANEIPVELTRLAEVTQANYENIKTLQGKATVEHLIMYRGPRAANALKQLAGISDKEPNEIADLTEIKGEFKLDSEKDLIYRLENWATPSEVIDIENNIVYQTPNSSLDRIMIITGEYEIECLARRRKEDGTVRSRIAEKQQRRYPNTISGNSDPRKCFYVHSPVWEVLNDISNGAVKGFYNVILEKAQTEKGVIYRVQSIYPPADFPFQILILKEEKGFNPTYVEEKNLKGETTTKLFADFIEIDGIFIPTKRHHIRYDPKDGRLRQETRATFSDMQVNMPLPEQTFAISNLGLSNGDKFVNKIEGKEYIFQDANLVPVEK